MTFNKFSKVVKKNKYDIVILFSHWREDTIEFFDGLVGIPDIVKAIPYEFEGLIDLCVCHPEKLTFALRSERPKCLIRYTQKKATPYIWLYFYLMVFKRLKEENITYLQALELTINDFLNIKEKNFYEKS